MADPTVPMIESILLASARVFTFEQQRPLTNASAFFFAREPRLFLVASRHVVLDEPTRHFPDRIEIELHVDRSNSPGRPASRLRFIVTARASGAPAGTAPATSMLR